MLPSKLLVVLQMHIPYNTSSNVTIEYEVSLVLQICF